jgi:predicted MPP superfamily phosphohydrolase
MHELSRVIGAAVERAPSAGVKPARIVLNTFMISRRTFLKTSIAATAGTVLGVGTYAWRVEPHWLEIVSRVMPVRNLPGGLVGCRMAHLSDLHVGPMVTDDYLLHTFDRVAALKPDIVVYTGDFVSHETGLVAHAERVFAKLPHGRLATLGVLGNHDYGRWWAHPETAEAVVQLLGANRIRILRNEVADVAGLQIAGLDDIWARRFDSARTFAALDSERAAIALVHNPDAVDRSGWDPFRGWILAGHTHGGQCKPPFLPPPILPVVNQRYSAGSFFLSGRRDLYINRGVGHLLQARFNVRPEVTMFQLQRA